MKLTKKQLEAIKEIEKRVSEVCDAKKTVEVTRDDSGMIINKATKKPHFPELYPEINSREVEITLSFGEGNASLKWQLNKQGFELSDKFMFKAEQIRYDLHSLRKFGIVTDKQLWKSFNKLHKKICEKVINTQLKEGEISKLIETKKFKH